MSPRLKRLFRFSPLTICTNSDLSRRPTSSRSIAGLPRNATPSHAGRRGPTKLNSGGVSNR